MIIDSRYPNFFLYPEIVNDKAISEEANVLRKEACDAQYSADQIYSLFGNKSAAISKALEIVEECSVFGWDGENAKPISMNVLENTSIFVRALPESEPIPDFSPLPNGKLSLEWIKSQDCIFSLIIGDNNRLPCAWVNGEDNGSAVVKFNGENIPELILQRIKEIK